MKITIQSPKYGVVTFLIDKEDYPLLEKYHPYVHRIGHYTYIRVNPLKVHLHRLIMNPPLGMVIDHINRDTLDNRRSNLRICTIQQNLRNQKRPNNKTGYTGVSIGHKGKYNAQIKVNYKKIHLGTFDTIEEAYRERKKSENKYYETISTNAVTAG